MARQDGFNCDAYYRRPFYRPECNSVEYLAETRGINSESHPLFSEPLIPILDGLGASTIC